MSVPATKFAEFVSAKKLHVGRIIAASKELEGLQVEDRFIKAAKRAQKKGEGSEGPKETRKPRSGRPVTNRAIHAALTGAEKLSGPTKTRLLKAVNHLLEQKKQEKVELKALF
jgi:hypothetical protein